MNKIEICNLRNCKICYEYDVRVDRYNRILGNKFYMHDESERDDVCNKYHKYFYEQIESNKSFRDEVNRLIDIYNQHGKLRLFCWCAPKRCHAETIKEYILTNSKEK